MRFSQEMMALYKREQVNPLSGCLPLLLQMPIFLALYWVLMESVELRHAPWLGWIQDLSAMDPWFILPLIMGATMFAQQMLNPQPVRSNASESIPHYADYVYGIYVVLPCGSCVVLDCEQQYYNLTAMVY